MWAKFKKVVGSKKNETTGTSPIMKFFPLRTSEGGYVG